LANRFAAKEAFYKALNHNKKSRIPSFKDVEIMNAKGGMPYLNISNTAKKLCLELIPNGCSYKVHLSISDERHYAFAIVIIESLKND
jgi:holo-[acyl-carrier protein] synthase